MQHPCTTHACDYSLQRPAAALALRAPTGLQSTTTRIQTQIQFTQSLAGLLRGEHPPLALAADGLSASPESLAAVDEMLWMAAAEGGGGPLAGGSGAARFDLNGVSWLG